MTKRKKNGRFRKGPMSEEMKRAISEGQRRRHKRLEEQGLGGVREGELKRCTGCGKMKRVPEDYTTAKRVLAGGRVKRYPRAECKKCGAGRSAAWRAEQDQEQLKKKQKQWNKRRSKKARARYQREYGRLRRAEEGVVARGPWKKYRDEVGLDNTPTVDTAPLREWLQDKPLLPSDHVRARTVREIRNGKRKTTKLGTVDEILSDYQATEIMANLYPYAKASQRVLGRAVGG